MLLSKALQNQLEENNFFVYAYRSVTGDVVLGRNVLVSFIAKNRYGSLGALDNACLESYANVNTGFYKNVAIGAYCSFAEGVKIVPLVEQTEVQSFTLSPCRNKYVSPIFTKFKNQKLEHCFPPTIIGHDVWLGGNVQIKAGTIIGHGAVIGAGSVVTKHVPPYSIVVGNPARFLRLRFAEPVVERLLSSQWYTYDWENIELPWGEFEPCLEIMEQHIAEKSVPTLGQGCKLMSNEQGELSMVLATEQGAVSWTLEEHLQQRFGTSDMVEIFARPEIKEQSYQKM